MYQENRPENPYALISISHAVIEDDRIIFQTAEGEEVNLSNESLAHTSNSVERVTLPVQVSTSEEDGGFALLGFSSLQRFFYEQLALGYTMPSVRVFPSAFGLEPCSRPRAQFSQIPK